MSTRRKRNDHRKEQGRNCGLRNGQARRCSKGLPEVRRQEIEIHSIDRAIGIEVSLLPALSAAAEVGCQQVKVDCVDAPIAVGITQKQLLGHHVSVLDIILADAQIGGNAAIKAPFRSEIS